MRLPTSEKHIETLARDSALKTTKNISRPYTYQPKKLTMKYNLRKRFF